MTESLAQMFDDYIFALGCRGQGAVASFRGNDEHVVGVHNKAGNAETGAGTDHGHRRPRQRATTAQWIEVAVCKMGQRPSNGFEIVEQMDMGKAELSPQFSGIDDPWTVSERAALVAYHSSDRELSTADLRMPATGGEKIGQRIGKMCVITHGHVLDWTNRSVSKQCEAGIRAADIGEHNGIAWRGIQPSSFMSLRAHLTSPAKDLFIMRT
jgi:hypothetical protein